MPAIISGHLEMELHPWYGFATVIKINEVHKSIALKKYNFEGEATFLQYKSSLYPTSFEQSNCSSAYFNN